MESRIEKMEKELAELTVRVKDITFLIEGGLSFHGLPKHERDLLVAQQSAMLAYLSALSARFNLATRV